MIFPHPSESECAKWLKNYSSLGSGQRVFVVCVFVLQCFRVVHFILRFHLLASDRRNCDIFQGEKRKGMFLNWGAAPDSQSNTASIFQMRMSLCWGGCLLRWHRVCTSAGVIYGGNTQLCHRANTEAQELTKMLNGFVGYYLPHDLQGIWVPL